MKTLRDEIRAKYPERAARSVKSAKSAIRLNCIECCGGDVGEARRCHVKDCFLWPHVRAWRDLSKIEPATDVDTASADADESGIPIPPSKRLPPPPRAKVAKEEGTPLDRAPGVLVGKTLRHAEADGTVRECVVTERGFEYGGAVYTSISAAAKAASGRKAANGWEYWSLAK